MCNRLLREGLGFDPESMRGVVGRDESKDKVTYTDEMFDGALMCFGEFRKLVSDLLIFGGDTVGVEKKIHIGRIHPDCVGYVDWFIYDPKREVLWVMDYKFGRGLVNVESDEQLEFYAIGILSYLGIPEDKNVKVRMGVVQPRASHPDGPIRWSQPVEADYLRGERCQMYSLAAVSATLDNPPLRTGPHCQYCDGRLDCSALRKSAMDAVQYAEVSTIPDELTSEQISLEMVILKETVKLLYARLNALEAEAEALIENGKTLPHWIGEKKYGNRAWDKSDNEILELGKAFSADLSKRSLVSPAQAEKMGVPKTVVSLYVKRPYLGTKLVRDNNSKAKNIFGVKK